MKEFLEVFKYTLKENIKKKSFIISTIVILIIIVAAMVIPAIITDSKSGSSGGKVQSQGNSQVKNTVYFIDNSGYFADKLQELQNYLPEFQLKQEEAGNVEGIKAEIKEKGNSYLIVAGKNNEIPTFEYYTKQYGEGPSPNTVGKAFKTIYTTDLLKQANVEDATIAKVQGDLPVNVTELGKSMLGGMISSIAICVILFFAVYFYGYGVSMSVASEKTSRVMEILVTSVKPSRIILGKTAGMGLVGLIQLAVIIAVGVFTYISVFPDNFTIEGMKLELSGFTPAAIALMIVYFILGYSLYALMNAVVGATVSKAEDVNSAMMPMSFIAIISFYAAYGTFAVPDSTAARIVSLIPFTAPFSVPSRLISTDVPAWEIALSLALLIIAVILIGTVSIKLYSYAVLHYGDRLRLGKLFKMSRSETKVVTKP